MSEFTHAKCGKSWGGLLTSHCGACCTNFTGLSAFDKHRTGSHSKGRYCLDPSTAIEENPESSKFGQPLFKLTDRKYPCWALAGHSPEWWKE